MTWSSLKKRYKSKELNTVDKKAEGKPKLRDGITYFVNFLICENLCIRRGERDKHPSLISVAFHKIASKANIFRIFDYSKNLTWKTAKNTLAKIKNDF